MYVVGHVETTKLVLGEVWEAGETVVTSAEGGGGRGSCRWRTGGGGAGLWSCLHVVGACPEVQLFTDIQSDSCQASKSGLKSRSLFWSRMLLCSETTGMKPVKKEN